MQRAWSLKAVPDQVGMQKLAFVAAKAKLRGQTTFLFADVVVVMQKALLDAAVQDLRFSGQKA